MAHNAQMSEAAQRLIAEALATYASEIQAEKDEKVENGSKHEDEEPEPSAAVEAGQDPEGAAGSAQKPKSNSKMIEFKLSEVNPMITCRICNGYLIDATTIIECLHTFCKSCIVKHFGNSNHCPVCSILVHETNPLEMLRPLCTSLSQICNEMKKSASASSTSRTALQHVRTIAAPALLTTPAAPAPVEPPKPAEQPKKRSRTDSAPHETAEDEQISFVLEKEDAEIAEDGTVAPLEKPYIRTSARATILHLKKFLAKKLSLPKPDAVDILCKGEVLGNEHQLEYIVRTRWRTQGAQLVLHYRPRVEFQV